LVREIRRRTNGVVFQHAQRPVRSRPDERLVVACHGHGDEADGYGAGFRCLFSISIHIRMLDSFLPRLRDCETARRKDGLKGNETELGQTHVF
jgi:hypothetical protein